MAFDTKRHTQRHDDQGGQLLFEDLQWLKYATVPIIAGVIGYVTNWLAVRMTFRPLEFVGIPPYLGWQGIIPLKARKMASISVESVLSKIGTLREIAQQMDPERIAEHIVATVEPRIPQMVDEYAKDSGYADLWNTMPEALREVVYTRVRRKLPEKVRALTTDVADNIDDLLDLRLMVVDQLAEDKELLNRIFLDAGEREFKFIVNSGLWFGFVLGLFQMVLQLIFDAWWILPVAGIVIGYVTNWLALKIIFEPLEPRRIGPFVVQGLFLKRQKEVAAVFCRLVTREILTLRNFVNRLLTGPRSDRTLVIVRRHMKPLVDEAVGLAKPMVQMAMGTQEYRQGVERMSVQAAGMSDLAFEDPVFNAERAVAVEHEMRARMEQLTPTEFQTMLRPAFQEDEIKLIVAGAILGGLAGMAQSIFVFGGIG
jgi:uncharacterized membrane protein YheB (UPF0754 family)